jgi:hypothetical protein
VGNITFATNALKTITLRGDERITRTISNSATLFTLSYGITLVLGNNIRLIGNGKGGGLVRIEQDGTLRMEVGATISGGSSSDVMVNGGTFTMSGGTISGNTAHNGGGVAVDGNFTKTGGTIDGTNSAGIGRVVLFPISNTSFRKRETAAGPEVNMDSRVDGRAGGWE